MLPPVKMAHQLTPSDGKVLGNACPKDVALYRQPASGRLRALVEFVQGMAALSYAVLRIPGEEHLEQGRADVSAAIGP